MFRLSVGSVLRNHSWRARMGLKQSKHPTCYTALPTHTPSLPLKSLLTLVNVFFHNRFCESKHIYCVDRMTLIFGGFGYSCSWVTSSGAWEGPGGVGDGNRGSYMHGNHLNLCTLFSLWFSLAFYFEILIIFFKYQSIMIKVCKFYITYSFTLS